MRALLLLVLGLSLWSLTVASQSFTHRCSVSVTGRPEVSKHIKIASNALRWSMVLLFNLQSLQVPGGSPPCTVRTRPVLPVYVHMLSCFISTVLTHAGCAHRSIL